MRVRRPPSDGIAQSVLRALVAKRRNQGCAVSLWTYAAPFHVSDHPAVLVPLGAQEAMNPGGLRRIATSDLG